MSSTRLLSPATSIGSSAPSPGQSDASSTGQTACVLFIRPSLCGFTRFLFLSRFTLGPAEEKPRGSTGRQTAAPLKSDDITALVLDPGFLIQYRLVRPLTQTTSGDQRLAHICDFLVWCSWCFQHSFSHEHAAARDVSCGIRSRL